MNAEDVAAHVQGVADGIHLAVWVEIPVNGNLADAKFFSTCEIKQFDVEGPAHQGLFLEEVLRGFGAKTFEAALRIVQTRQDQGENDKVDGASTDVTIGGFVITNGARRFTRADGNIKVADCRREKFLQVFDGHGKVGIADETIFAARCEHSAPDGVALALVMFLNDDQVGVIFDELHGKFKGEV